jgi:hypothetical protein
MEGTDAHLDSFPGLVASKMVANPTIIQFSSQQPGPVEQAHRDNFHLQRPEAVLIDM